MSKCWCLLSEQILICYTGAQSLRETHLSHAVTTDLPLTHTGRLERRQLAQTWVSVFRSFCSLLMSVYDKIHPTWMMMMKMIRDRYIQNPPPMLELFVSIVRIRGWITFWHNLLLPTQGLHILGNHILGGSEWAWGKSCFHIQSWTTSQRQWLGALKVMGPEGFFLNQGHFFWVHVLHEDSIVLSTIVVPQNHVARSRTEGHAELQTILHLRTGGDRNVKDKQFCLCTPILLLDRGTLDVLVASPWVVRDANMHSFLGTDVADPHLSEYWSIDQGAALQMHQRFGQTFKEWW